MFRLIIVALALVSQSAVSAEQLDPTNPSDALTINRKIQCSLVDGEQVTWYWFGNAYSRRAGERDKLLFKVEGMNTRACSSDNHPQRGEGYKLVSREILLYKDPETGEVLATWENPWTGETVDVLHVANDPVNFQAYQIGRNGEPAGFRGEIAGNNWWMTNTVPLFYPNPLASEFQSEIGGTYHATEMFNFFGNVDSLLDPDLKTAPAKVGWVRMSDWLPWMKMSGREGVIYMHTAGHKLDSWDQLSDTMKQEIKQHYPEYTSPPPLDDQRRNVTSWSYFKDVREGKVAAPKR